VTQLPGGKWRRIQRLAQPLLLVAISQVSAVEQASTLSNIYYGESIERLRTEISINLKSQARGRGLAAPLRFAKYTVQRGDDFFRIVTKTHQDPDTIASLNRLVSAGDLAPGDVILIPNARGLFQDLPASESIAIPDRALFFLPGRRLHPEERKIFQGDNFVYPLKEFILTSNYGSRLDPFSNKLTFHGGLDLAAPSGTSVLASRAGIVRFAGKMGGYGNLVVIDHGHGYKTLYGHLSTIVVKVGDPIKGGEKLGAVGSTGLSTGPHLHFEMRKDGRQQRPHFVHGTIY